MQASQHFQFMPGPFQVRGQFETSQWQNVPALPLLYEQYIPETTEGMYTYGTPLLNVPNIHIMHEAASMSTGRIYGTGYEEPQPQASQQQQWRISRIKETLRRLRRDILHAMDEIEDLINLCNGL